MLKGSMHKQKSPLKSTLILCFHYCILGSSTDYLAEHFDNIMRQAEALAQKYSQINDQNQVKGMEANGAEESQKKNNTSKFKHQLRKRIQKNKE